MLKQGLKLAQSVDTDHTRSSGQDLCSIEQIIDDARNGRMFILVDDEDRENEGDLVVPAQMCTPDKINFMAKYGRGLICLALCKDNADRLGLQLLPQTNSNRLSTAFTISIEAREGVTTGISAADRAHTIGVAISHQSCGDDITTPGHVFPIVAREGGVLVRAGHTEAAVDIARLAGLTTAGVICEIMNDDGKMARLPQLREFAQEHGLNIASIADLIAYKRVHESLIERVSKQPFQTKDYGDFTLYVYRSKTPFGEHIALVKGNIIKNKDILVRMHALDLLYDVLDGVSKDKPSGILHASLEHIAREGSGVLVLLRELQVDSLSRRAEELKISSNKNNMPLRDYGVGAQILLDLNISTMTLLSTTKPIAVGLEGYGLTISGYKKLDI